MSTDPVCQRRQENGKQYTGERFQEDVNADPEYRRKREEQESDEHCYRDPTGEVRQMAILSRCLLGSCSSVGNCFVGTVRLVSHNCLLHDARIPEGARIWQFLKALGHLAIPANVNVALLKFTAPGYLFLFALTLAAFPAERLADLMEFLASGLVFFAAALTLTGIFFIDPPEDDFFRMDFPAFLPATPPTMAPTAAPRGQATNLRQRLPRPR